MSKIKTEYYLEMLKPEIMKLLGSTQRKITRDKNCLDVAQMEFIEVALVYCNIVNNQCHHISKVLYTFFPNK